MQQTGKRVRLVMEELRAWIGDIEDILTAGSFVLRSDRQVVTILRLKKDVRWANDCSNTAFSS